jgi:DNA-binding response OmpR family regulator
VIMITARPEPLLHARALESGAFCLLKKPFETDEFIACLNRALVFGSKTPARVI